MQHKFAHPHNWSKADYADAPAMRYLIIHDFTVVRSIWRTTLA
jgi:hypothetical protein